MNGETKCEDCGRGALPSEPVRCIECARRENARLRADLASSEEQHRHSLPRLVFAAQAEIEIASLRARVAEADDLLRRSVKYAREDSARTPGFTRLARVLVKAERFLARAKHCPARCPHGDRCALELGHAVGHVYRNCDGAEGGPRCCDLSPPEPRSALAALNEGDLPAERTSEKLPSEPPPPPTDPPEGYFVIAGEGEEGWYWGTRGYWHAPSDGAVIAGKRGYPTRAEAVAAAWKHKRVPMVQECGERGCDCRRPAAKEGT